MKNNCLKRYKKSSQIVLISSFLFLSIFGHCSSVGRIDWSKVDLTNSAQPTGGGSGRADFTVFDQEAEKEKQELIRKTNEMNKGSVGMLKEPEPIEAIPKQLEPNMSNGNLDNFFGFNIRGLLGAIMGLIMGLVAGTIGLIQYYRKKNNKNINNTKEKPMEPKIEKQTRIFLRKISGEILSVIGFGIFTFNVLDIRHGYSHYYSSEALIFISIGIMLSASGIFIFINKIRNNK
ncbi:MAG: hypothetical protein NTU76_01305 [Candidatus Taylorbacteria bacterium]|nr:hypothetical protein [Candidatus Taylorbacteria bacterium]